MRKRKTGIAREKMKPYRFDKQMDFLRACFEEESLQDNPESDEDKDDKVFDSFGTIIGKTLHNPTEQEFEDFSLADQSINIKLENVSSSTALVQDDQKESRTLSSTSGTQISYLENSFNEVPKDHLSTFFQTVELTVRNFPLALQIEAKKKIFEVVTDLEMMQATYPS